MNGVDKFVREAMPIQEEEKASRKPAAKARPILNPSSTSGWDSTLMEQRQWIDIEIQESKDPYCFQVSKFISRLLRHSQQVNREEDAGVHYDQVFDDAESIGRNLATNSRASNDTFPGETSKCQACEGFKAPQTRNVVASYDARVG